MAEQIIYTDTTDKKLLYEQILPQVEALMASEQDKIANMANLSAILKEVFRFFWVGFYIVRDNQLVLGPFQGPLACTRINYGKGVCGSAWKAKQTLIVPDVDQFPGHIACSSLSKSEIVIPLFCGEDVCAVLDVDSDAIGSFDEIDAYYLSKLIAFI